LIGALIGQIFWQDFKMDQQADIMDRLDRLEKSDEKLEQAIVKIGESIHDMAIILARLTERNETFDRIWKHIEKIEDGHDKDMKEVNGSINEIEKRLPVVELMGGVIKWGVCGIIAAVASAIGALIFIKH
jgi:DNA anti-recombination protein RmuC